MARSVLRAGKILVGIIIAIIIVVIILYSAGVISIAQTIESPLPNDGSVLESSLEYSSEYTPEQLKLVAIIDKDPETYDALLALKKLVIQHLKVDQNLLATNTIYRLLGQFADSPHLPNNIHDLARKAVDSGKYDTVLQICEYLDSTPELTNAPGVWLKMMEALAAVYKGDDTILETATESLAAEHSTDGRCVEAFGQIAYAFRQLKQYERSRQYYQFVVETWPHGPRAIYSQRGLIWVNQKLNNQDDAVAALNILLAEYKDDPDLVECVRPLADSYEQKKDFNTAIRIHQYVSDNRPEDPMAIWSQFKVFKIALAELHENELAETAYQQIWDRFGTHNRIAQVICEAAWECRKLKRHDEALQMYRAALAAQPENDRAIIAQRGIIHCLLALKDYPAAAAESQKLLTAFSDDKQLPARAIEVGDALSRSKLYPEALTLYQYVVEHFPNDSRAITAQRKAATMNIDMENESTAQQVLDSMALRFADDPQLSSEFYAIGEHYRLRKRYFSARVLYDFVATEFPQTNDGMWSKQRCMLMDIDLLDDPNNPTSELPSELQQATDDFIANYTSQPGMVKALLYTGEEYYNRAFRKDPKGLSSEAITEFSKASTIFSKIINQAPIDPKYTGDAYYMTAVGLSRSGNFKESIAYHQALLNNWPEHNLAWSSQYWIGSHYQSLKKQGVLSAEEADAAMEQAYLTLFSKFSNTPMVQDARKELAWMYFQASRYEEALEIYESLVRDGPPDEKVSRWIYNLGQTYDRLNYKEMALQAYQEFVSAYPDLPTAEHARKRISELGRAEL
ncbi:MAG: tetratricopeptide repeat protein [Sedimentisphaerales bacterium]|nr:tetratricopeptide repeat protein [Sedimentisphaerales bacterium]